MRRPKLDATTWAQLNHLLDSALDQPASALGPVGRPAGPGACGAQAAFACAARAR